MSNLSDRLRRALEKGNADSPELIAGDTEYAELAGHIRPVQAAVLVAITDRAQPGVILTQRNDRLRRHAGQVAFPGGRIDPDDSSPIGAALREANEEVALDPNAVDLIGTADLYRTVTGYQVTPVLGVIAPDLPLVPSPDEVSAIFEVPLDFLLNADNARQATLEWQGRPRHYYEFIWEDRRIWGATAAMIVNLSRRLQWLT